MPPSSDAAVIATNDDAFTSKLASMHVGYFSDPYLAALQPYLASETPVRPPLINRGTALRVQFKSDVVDAFIAEHESPQIVLLGAGFDSTPFRVVSNLRGGMIVELDLRDVVKAKASAIMECEVIRKLFSDIDHTETYLKGKTAGGTYVLQEFDLRNTSQIPGLFQSIGIDSNKPTLIIAEIILIYLHAQTSDDILQTLSTYFTNKAILTIEHVNPHTPFGREMILNIASRGSPLLSIHTYPTLSSQSSRYTKLGWSPCTTRTLLDLFRIHYPPDKALALNRIQHLDEVEEFNLLLSHYGFILAGPLSVSLCNSLLRLL